MAQSWKQTKLYVWTRCSLRLLMWVRCGMVSMVPDRESDRSETSQSLVLSEDTHVDMDISHRHSLHHNNASSLLGSASKTVHHLSLRVKINTVSEMYDPPETVPAPIIQESRGEPELASRTLTVFLHTSLLVYQVRVLCVM